VSEFSLIFAFRENEKGVFVSTLHLRYCFDFAEIFNENRGTGNGFHRICDIKRSV
jgi:hypothetical protein